MGRASLFAYKENTLHGKDYSVLYRILINGLCIPFEVNSMNSILTELEKKSYILQWRLWKSDRKKYVGYDIHGLSFKEKLKEAKMQPCKITMYGQNMFACDDNRRKLLIKSAMATNFILLDYSGLVSYKLERDGIVLAGKPQDGLGGSSGYDAVPDENRVICTDLKITIETKDTSCPKVIIPFIYFPQKSEKAYKQALDAARETAKALESIYYSRG
jgi:hypothetical protein